MPHIRRLLAALAALLLLTGCYYNYPDKADRWAVTGDGTIDSVSFYRHHHYWRNFDFSLAGEPLTIATSYPGSDGVRLLQDSVTLRPHDVIVVADVRYVPADTVDSVWVKVARDQLTQGWVREKALLEKAVPDSPISRFIHNFSDRRMLFVLTCLGAAVFLYLVQVIRRKRALIVHFNDINSFYPTLLCIVVSGAAALYGSVQHFVPETWIEFYYHPTLNPFVLPPVVGFFIASVWLMLVVAIAVVDDVRRCPDPVDVMSYLAGLAGICMVLYLFFTLTVRFYIGYPLLLVYWAFALRCHLRRRRPRYICGACHRPMTRLGRCPHCGAVNS